MLGSAAAPAPCATLGFAFSSPPNLHGLRVCIQQHSIAFLQFGLKADPGADTKYGNWLGIFNGFLLLFEGITMYVSLFRCPDALQAPKEDTYTPPQMPSAQPQVGGRVHAELLAVAAARREGVHAAHAAAGNVHACVHGCALFVAGARDQRVITE